MAWTVAEHFDQGLTEADSANDSVIVLNILASRVDEHLVLPGRVLLFAKEIFSLDLLADTAFEAVMR